MIALKISVVAKSDPGPIFPDIEPGWVEAKLDAAALLEGGMSSGNTSIMLKVDLPNGKSCIVQTSAAIVEALAAAVRGAKERFGDVDKDSPTTH